MKTVKAILAIALASQLFLACSKDAANSNANANSNSNANANSKTISTTNTNTTSKANTNAGGETASTDSSTASGDNRFTHKEGGIQFDLPAGWKSNQNGDQMTLSTADGTVSVVIWVPAGDSFQEATAALDKELGKTIKNMKDNGEPKETTINGMQAVNLSGTGEVDGEAIQWAVDLIKAKKPVIVLTFSAPGASDKHEGAYKQFASSIKPA